MNTPVVAYSSGGQPLGPAGGIPLLLQFYRPNKVIDAAGLAYNAIVVPFGAESTDAAPVGGLISISELGLELAGKEMTTTGRYGENNDDPTVLREGPKLNCGTFVQSSGQPTIVPGDFVNLIVGRPITSTPATPVNMKVGRWYIGANSLSTSGFNKWALKLGFDRPNSDPAFDLF